MTGVAVADVASCVTSAGVNAREERLMAWLFCCSVRFVFHSCCVDVCVDAGDDGDVD